MCYAMLELFATFNVISSQNQLLWHYLTNWNQTLYECFLGYPAYNWKKDFWSFKKTWPLLLKIEHRGQIVVFHIYIQNHYVLPIGTKLGMTVLGVSCIELMWGFLILQKIWPLLLKIEGRSQILVFRIYLQNC